MNDDLEVKTQHPAEAQQQEDAAAYLAAAKRVRAIYERSTGKPWTARLTAKDEVVQEGEEDDAPPTA